jgi:hypothetical protein
MQFRENALMLHSCSKHSRGSSTPRPRCFLGYRFPRRSGRDDRVLVILVVDGGLVGLRSKGRSSTLHCGPGSIGWVTGRRVLSFFWLRSSGRPLPGSWLR